MKKLFKYCLIGGLLFANFNYPSCVLAENNSRISPAKNAMVFPLLSPILSSNYGKRNHPILKSIKHHGGIDLAAPLNSHVRAVLGGIVIFSGELSAYGNIVSIKHEQDYVSVYGHLHSISVEVGQRIEAGTIIGRVGSTGRSTGPHLHFEWRKNGEVLDPLKYFPGLVDEPLG